MDDELRKKMLNLSTQYRCKLPDIIASIESQWNFFTSTSSKEYYQQFIKALNDLAGSGGSYGYLKLSELAKETESYLHKNFKSWQKEYITGQLNKIKLEIQSILSVAKKEEIKEVEKSKPRRDKMIYCLVDNATQGLIKDLHQFGYNIQFYSSFLELTNKERPDALIVDTEKLEAISVPTLEAIFHNWVVETPIIYISSHDDVATRLKAVHYYGSSFMVVPLKVFPLLEKLEYLSNEPESKSSRVLMLEDTGKTADYYKLLMQDAGISVKKIEDPELLLSACEEFQPDLIIMDIRLLKVSGIDLAKVLRQDERYSTIPIIYISPTVSKEAQLTAFEIDADDFLTKPINPKYLISRVKNKIARANMLRSRIMRDSLTKLYNHTFIHQHLEVAIKVAQRYHSPLAFVMLDIDNFKMINDSYGHPVGDRVLRNLSQFLRQHLRESDVVGRYGGEEFAIILPYTEPMAAFQLFDQLRYDFAMINQLGDEKNLMVTFSVGIAPYIDNYDSQALISVADKALYQAKEKGRNVVVIFAE